MTTPDARGDARRDDLLESRPADPRSEQPRDDGGLEEEDAADLPERQAMSLLDPTAVLGSGLLGGGAPTGGTSPAPSPTDTGISTPLTGGSTAPANPAASPIPLPNLPALPHDNPTGTYNPDTSASSRT